MARVAIASSQSIIFFLILLVPFFDWRRYSGYNFRNWTNTRRSFSILIFRQFRRRKLRRFQLRFVARYMRWNTCRIAVQICWLWLVKKWKMELWISDEFWTELYKLSDSRTRFFAKENAWLDRTSLSILDGRIDGALQIFTSSDREIERSNDWYTETRIELQSAIFHLTMSIYRRYIQVHIRYVLTRERKTGGDWTKKKQKKKKRIVRDNIYLCWMNTQDLVTNLSYGRLALGLPADDDDDDDNDADGRMSAIWSMMKQIIRDREHAIYIYARLLWFSVGLVGLFGSCFNLIKEIFETVAWRQSVIYVR